MIFCQRSFEFAHGVEMWKKLCENLWMSSRQLLSKMAWIPVEHSGSTSNLFIKGKATTNTNVYVFEKNPPATFRQGGFLFFWGVFSGPVTENPSFSVAWHGVGLGARFARGATQKQVQGFHYNLCLMWLRVKPNAITNITARTASYGCFLLQCRAPKKNH